MTDVRFFPGGAALFRLPSSADGRGMFSRLFCRQTLAQAGISFSVCQASLSRNLGRHLLRGLHFQRAPMAESKLVSCLSGGIYDVAVDLRPDSPTRLQWHGVVLGPEEGCFYIPAGFAHGFLTLSDEALVLYHMDAPWSASHADGVRWDDPALGISWPAPPAILSERDRNWPDIVP